MPLGPDYDKLFLTRRLIWSVPEHAKLIQRYLAFYQSEDTSKDLCAWYESTKPEAPKATETQPETDAAPKRRGRPSKSIPQ